MRIVHPLPSSLLVNLALLFLKCMEAVLYLKVSSAIPKKKKELTLVSHYYSSFLLGNFAVPHHMFILRQPISRPRPPSLPFEPMHS